MAASLILDAYEVSGSVNIENNTSRLYVRLQIRTTGGTYNHTGDTVGSVSINGQSYSLNGKNVDYNTTTTLYEATHTITHTTDGSKSLTVAAEFDPNTPGTSRMLVCETVDLTDIPRASAVAATDANIGGTSMLAVNRRSSDYTHTVAFAFGELSGYLGADGRIAQSPVQLSETAIAFTVPESFYEQIPDAPSGICTLTCTTYKGDTQIGEAQTATFTVTADPQLCAPKIAYSVRDLNAKTIALTGNSSILLRHASRARCGFAAEGRNGATIREKTLNGQVITDTTVIIDGIADGAFVFTATDSRGYTTVKRIYWPIRDYVPLTVNLTVGRTDPTSGNATVTVTGNYFDGTFGAADNTLQITCTVAGQEKTLTPTITGNTYRAVESFSGLDYRQSYSVSVSAVDAINTISRTATIGKGVPVFDWGEEDFRFHVPVSVPEPAADDHALNRKYAAETFFPKTGGNINGTALMGNGSGIRSAAVWPYFVFKDDKDKVRCSLMLSDKNQLHFNLQQTGATAAERFYLPIPGEGLQEDVTYAVLTSKHAVKVEQGGTGASDGATARANLGIGCTKLLSAEGTVAGHGKYKMYLVLGKPGQDSSVMSLLIPAAEVTGTAVRYQIADNLNYVAFHISATGDKLTVTKTAGTGSLTAVYGIN